MAGSDLSFVNHLEELRRRIIISALAILVTTVASFFAADFVLKLLLLPSGGLRLRAFNLLDGFMIKVRLALYTGIVIAFPVWAFQILGFISPGLRADEKRGLYPFLFSALLLFALGTAFGYYLLWGMIRVLIQLFPAQVEYLPSAVDYISFVVFFLHSLRYCVRTALHVDSPGSLSHPQVSPAEEAAARRILRAFCLCRDHHARERPDCGPADRHAAAGDPL